MSSRLMIQCGDFLIKRRLIQKRGDFFTEKPPRDAAEMLVAWIMELYALQLIQVVDSQSFS
jgi:hypothetical protein